VKLRRNVSVESSDSKEYLRISYIVSREEWDRLCEAHFTPVSVMDLLNIYPREMQIERVDSEGDSIDIE
jgi:hypothetical protein